MHWFGATWVWRDERRIGSSCFALREEIMRSYLRSATKNLRD